jgi:hypothetical protein
MRQVALFDIFKEADRQPEKCITWDQFPLLLQLPTVFNVTQHPTTAFAAVRAFQLYTKPVETQSQRASDDYTILWSSDKSTFSWKGISLPLLTYTSSICDAWTQTLRHLLSTLLFGFSDIHKFTEDVFMGNRILTDHLGNTDIDYSFLQANEAIFSDISSKYFDYLVHKFGSSSIPHTQSSSAAGDVVSHFSEQFRRDYICAARKFIDLFIVAAYFSSGKSQRESEIGAHLLVNTTQHVRGVFWLHGQLMLIPNHDKMKGRRNQTSDGIRFLDRHSSCFIALPYVILIRPLLVYIYKSFEQYETATVFYCHAFVDGNGCCFTNNSFSTQLRAFTAEKFNITGWGTKDCRQVVISFYNAALNSTCQKQLTQLRASRYAVPPPQRLSMNQAGHTDSTEMLHYGFENISHPAFPQTRIEEHRETSTYLHNILNLEATWNKVLGPNHRIATHMKKKRKLQSTFIAGEADHDTQQHDLQLKQQRLDLSEFPCLNRETEDHHELKSEIQSMHNIHMRDYERLSNVVASMLRTQPYLSCASTSLSQHPAGSWDIASSLGVRSDNSGSLPLHMDNAYVTMMVCYILSFFQLKKKKKKFAE